MNMIKRTLSLVLALMMLCAACACAEELYWSSDSRIPDLYTEKIVTFYDYFTLAIPDEWQTAEISENDQANGILACFADDFEDPKARMVVSIFTPDECSDIFGGTGYDAIFDCLNSEYDDVKSILINNTWTITYYKNEDHPICIIDFTTADGYMFQIKFDVNDASVGDYVNNIIKSLQSIK